MPSAGRPFGGLFRQTLWRQRISSNQAGLVIAVQYEVYCAHQRQ